MATTGLKVAASRGFASSKEGISKLSNGLSLLSVPELRGPGLLRVSVCSGSRYEKYDNLGVSHALRTGAGLSTGSHSYFGITRNMQQSGAAFNVSQGREILSFSLIAPKKELLALSELLVDSVSNPAFKHWEISDECPVRIKNDIFNQSPASKAQELLYKAAFRNGLGNSLYAPSHMIGAHSAAMLKDFYSKTFVAERASIIGLGLSQEHLLQVAEQISLASTSSLKPSSSVFLSKELRSEQNGSQCHIALGFAGASLAASPKERLSALLYQRIMGVGSRVKWGTGLGKLDKVGGATVSASCIAASHQDAGLFGAYVACFDHKLSGDTVKRVIEFLKNPKITEAEVKSAKKNLLTDLSEAYLSPTGFCDLLEEQILLGGGQQLDFKTAEESIHAITVGDVQAFAKKVSGSPMSMGAHGNLECLPYMDEL